MLKESQQNLYAFSSLNEALKFCRDNYQKTIDSIIIGGGLQMYREVMERKMATELLITEIHKDLDCDLFFGEIPGYYVEKTAENSDYAKLWEEKGITLKLRHFELSEN